MSNYKNDYKSNKLTQKNNDQEKKRIGDTKISITTTTSNTKIITRSTGKLPVGTFRGEKGIPKQVNITRQVFEKIINTIGSKLPESGGMLGTSDGEVIDTYVFDENALTDSSEYNPNIESLNHIIEKEWAERGIILIGMIHSHPQLIIKPSSADLQYARNIIQSFEGMKYLYIPIVNSSLNNGFSIYSYIISLDDKERPVSTKIDLYIDDEKYCPGDVVIFSKIHNALPLKWLQNSTVIGIGVGGARDVYIDSARCGVGHFVLIDGDVISETNVSTQGVYSSEIGKSKVEMVKKKILDVNNRASVITINEYLNDELDDEWFESILNGAPDRNNAIITAFTDDFYAQARAARLSLKYSIPYISAQHYQNGVGSEIVYWYPNVTKTCPRCILKDRYNSYLKNDYVNNVTSEGSPIFNTTRLNSLCEKIAIGILIFKHNRDSIYSHFIKTSPEKNLILIRHNPFLGELLEMDCFSDDGYIMDDVVWLDYSSKSTDDAVHHCFDCKGKTNAKDISESIIDSRVLT